MRARHAVVVPSRRIASDSALGWLSFPAAFTFPTKAILTFHSFPMALGDSSLLQAVKFIEYLFFLALRALEPFSKERLVHLITIVAN
jgi:hypothetical protein